MADLLAEVIQDGYTCDASKLGEFTLRNDSPNNITASDVRTVLQELSLGEVHSILFLLLDFYDNTDISFRAKCYIQWVKHPKEILLDKILEICKDRNNCDIFLELLGTIQEFKLLRRLGSCKHQFFERQNAEINQLWKLLFFICKEIDKDELVSLKCRLSLNNVDITFCEQLICYLFQFGDIKENDLTKLSDALVSIKRQDLGLHVSNFTPIYQSIQKYFIPVANATQPSGRCIIINNEVFNCNGFPQLSTRHGTKHDSDGLSSLWRGYGLETIVYDNLSAAEISTLFERLAHDEFKHCFVLVICLLSHGDRDHIYGSDGVPVNTNTLVKHLAENTFLTGKPKVFIVQACQGEKEQKANIRQQNSNTALIYRKDNKMAIGAPVDCSITAIIPEFNDIYIAYSTIPGFVSYRNSTGSIFISEILKHYENCGHRQDIDQILRIVSREVGKKGQTIVTSSTLNKQLIFSSLGQNEAVQS